MGIGLWFLVVFGTKAAVFPLFSWLPDSYPTAPTTITAVFAGLLTKIGVYSLIRFHTSPAWTTSGRSSSVWPVVTMLVGVAGALAQDDVKRILSFHIVSQIGYMLMGLGLFTVAGVAGAVLFLVHQIPIKTVLFLVGGLIEAEAREPRRSTGSAGSPPVARSSPLCSRCRAQPRRPAAVLGVRRQARPGRRRDRAWLDPHRRRRPGRQPAHPAVDDQDLARRVLGVTAGRADGEPRRPGRASVRRVGG